MRSAELYEEEESTTGSGELNLGLGSLIGIFFGLALVCGVFFGFGYMMGHRKPSLDVSSEAPAAAANATAPKPSAQIPERLSEAARVVVPASSAGSTEEAGPVENAANIPAPAKTSALTPAPIPEQSARTVAALPAKPASAALVAPAPAASGAQGALNGFNSSGSIMVQIAAVKSRPDAEALAAALEKNGFRPTIRSESQDKLLHVQVGPFESRDEARTMRQRLANAGYNAFIK